jgi:hypothetical protein
MKAANPRLPQRLSRGFAMQSKSDHNDEFIQKQVQQLQAQGQSPEAAADVVVQAMKACSEALQNLLERAENGEPLTDQNCPASEIRQL